MSLTSFIAESDVKLWFKTNFSFKNPTIQPLPCFEPRTKRYTMIGTAYDYLLRFKLQYTYPFSIDKPWIAEHVINPDALNLIAEMYDKTTAKAIEQVVLRARRNHKTYLATGNMTDDLLKSTIQLAQVDPFFRARVLGIPFGEVDDEDIADLQALYDIIPAQLLHAKNVCLLNPVFTHSALVGGADADIVLDNTIIDIKTTKNLKITREHINQLLGYYILHRIGGFHNAPEGHKIDTIGIYFSRHGYLHTWPVVDFISETTYPALQEWFIQRAKQTFLQGLSIQQYTQRFKDKEQG